MPQGVAAVLIGLLLIRAGLLLVRRSHDFLVGAWALTAADPEESDPEAFTQPFSQTEQQRVWTYVLQFPGVTGVREIIATFLGPRRVWLVARVDIDDDLSGAQVQELVRGIESGLKHESVVFYRVDVAVTGGDHL